MCIRDRAKEVALMYKDIFKDGFYLEIQDHGMEEQRKVTEGNIKLAPPFHDPEFLNKIHL